MDFPLMSTSLFQCLKSWLPLTVWIITNRRKFLKRWEYQTTWSTSWEICMQVKKQHLELAMKQHTGSKLGKEYVKAVYCHPAHLTYMQSTSWEILGWMKHKLESRLLGEISITSDTQIHRWDHPYGRKWRRNKEPLDESQRGEWKSWLKTKFQKTKIMASGPITSGEIDGETVSDFIFIFWAPKSLQMVIAAMKFKDAYSLEGKLRPT